MAGYIGSKAVLLSTTAAVVTGDADIGGGLTVDTNTLFVDAASNNVGIGTSSPAFGAGSGLRIERADTATLRLQDTGAHGFEIRASASAAEFFSANAKPFTFETGGSERMRIDSSGNLLIANTAMTVGSSANTAQGIGFSPNYFGHIARSSTSTKLIIQTLGQTASSAQISFVYGASTVGTITSSSSGTAYNTTSDYRLKENVVPLSGAADRLAQIPVHRFNFIADPDRTVDGFLAHEVQKFVPECVTGEKDQVDDEGNPVYQGIDQSKLVPLLTAALQEALTKIDALEARIATLEGGAA